MIKKLITIPLFLAWFLSLGMVTYRAFEPQEAQAIEETPVVLAADARSVEQLESVNHTPTPQANQELYIISNDDSQDVVETNEPVEYNYYYFCVSEHENCKYINDFVFTDIKTELETESIPYLQYFDLSDSAEWTPARLQQKWGIEVYPAFVATATYSDGTTEFLSTLQWIDESPISADSLKTWMIDNDIWTGNIEVEEPQEVIEVPIVE